MSAAVSFSAPSLRRFALAGLCLIEALVLGGSSWLLSWRADLPSATVGGCLACAFGASALFALLGHPLFTRLVRISSWLALAAFGLLLARVTSWGLYLQSLYGEIGLVLWLALAIIGLALAFFLVPLPLHILSTVHGAPRSKPKGTASTPGAALVLLGLALGLGSSEAKADATPSGSHSEEAASLAQAWFAASGSAAKPAARFEVAAMGRARRFSCAQELTKAGAWVVTFRADKKVQQRCLQGSPAERKAAFLRLATDARPGSLVKLDFIAPAGSVPIDGSVISSLSLRPGLDGACRGRRCLLPWQLTVKDLHASNQPIPSVPDAIFGLDVEHLARGLDKNSSAPITRISSDSYLLSQKPGKSPSATRLQRMGRLRSPLTGAQLRRAQKLAISYILKAEQKDGSFRYILDPYTGKEDSSSLSIPRHAGTLLALCEFAPPERKYDRTIDHGLALLRRHLQLRGTTAYFTRSPRAAMLGETALPTIAILECQKRGHSFSARSARAILSYLMTMQRSDGSFRQHYSIKGGGPIETKSRELLYGSGQAVYALVLLEQFFNKIGDQSSASEAEAALDDAMLYYAGDYWQGAPENFFYLEENWHCLAARAALSSHRRDHYERFCVDYVDFKSRLLVDENSASGYAGGMVPSPVFPAQHTPTAGHVEALDAALAVLQVRGERRLDLEAATKNALSYLVKGQLDRATCFACKTDKAFGGITKSPASPEIRIDYVQHSLAAIGHAQEVLDVP